MGRMSHVEKCVPAAPRTLFLQSRATALPVFRAPVWTGTFCFLECGREAAALQKAPLFSVPSVLSLCLFFFLSTLALFNSSTLRLFDSSTLLLLFQDLHQCPTKLSTP